jgi:GT2 family glycosyltransferase
MDLSLSIPTYNRLPHLKKCLKSAIQGFKEFPDFKYEILIADGGSTDGTIKYLKDLNDENIKLIEQGKLTGIIKAYNDSFRIAKGRNIFIGNDDHFLIPKVLVKSCQLMDKEDQIGIVAVKMQEPTYANLHGVTRTRIEHFWTLLSKIHVFKAKALKRMNFFDEAYRSYYIDDDSTLSILAQGYTMVYTKEVGVIHYRVRDEKVNIAKAINYEKTRNLKELNYLFNKWKDLEENIQDYLKNSNFKKNKARIFTYLCDKMYYSKRLKPIIENNYEMSNKIFDMLLNQIVIFKDKDYEKLDDFFLSQKYPEKILSSLNY